MWLGVGVGPLGRWGWVRGGADFGVGLSIGSGAEIAGVDVKVRLSVEIGLNVRGGMGRCGDGVVVEVGWGCGGKTAVRVGLSVGDWDGTGVALGVWGRGWMLEIHVKS